jgi:hypothetical protein
MLQVEMAKLCVTVDDLSTSPPKIYILSKLAKHHNYIENLRYSKVMLIKWKRHIPINSGQSDVVRSH